MACLNSLQTEKCGPWRPNKIQKTAEGEEKKRMSLIKVVNDSN